MFSLLQSWSTASAGQAHLWITYGWLAVCSVAPIVVVLIIWATCMHFTYRAKWRTLDVLLSAALLQELPNALLVLVIGAVKSALIHLPRNLQAHSIFCYFLVWSNTTSRFFQFAILTSLIVDRALILKWPYRYRFAVRHSQIRLYLVIMAFVAMLVGGCAIVSHFYRAESDMLSIVNLSTNANEHQLRSAVMNQSLLPAANQLAINQTLSTSSVSVWSPLSQQHNVYHFSYNLSNFEVYFNCFFVSVYALFSLLSVVCFFYVECNRPRSSLSSSSTSSSSGTSKNRYLPSIATLFTSATNTSTTSSSTSSSLSTSSPLPTRFSSMANLANAAALSGVNSTHHHHAHHSHSHLHHHPQQPPQQKHSPQPANFFSGNGKREQHTPTGPNAPLPSSRNQNETLNSLYPISIVDMMGHESGQVMSSGYPSMIATDNSIYRMIEANNGNGSRSNSLSLITNGDSKPSDMNGTTVATPTNTPSTFQLQHRSNLSALSGHFTQSDPATSLDPLNPTSSSRVNSFSKAHLYSTASSQHKLNTTDSNDSSSFHQSASSAAHRSAFDFRWSSVVGPTTFCLAFNHGPYLIFSLLSLVMPEIWTPFHDLILVGLSLFEALLLPLIFYISDVTFREAVKKSCYCGGSRRRRHLSDKITSKSHHHPSLAFADRNLITPPYLKSLANPLPSKQQLSRPSSLAIQNYQSDLDLSSRDHLSSKINKISFLKHHSELSSKPMSNHATSMLDLSMSSRNAYHYGHGQGTRTRHSVALLPHLPNSSLTPRSSFRRRPPSVASYHYLYSSQQQQQQQQQSPSSASSNNKYPQYLFGAAPAKSESASNLPTLSGNSNNNSSSSNINYFSQLSAMKNFQLKKIKENEIDIVNSVAMAQLGSNQNLHNVPMSGSHQQLSSDQSTKADEKHLLNTKAGQKAIKELFNGLAARSSFKRRSVRKCGSDASTFYTRRNLKRSQIAHNQLSSILYNNFYIKKLGPPNFGSQMTLLSDNELAQNENGHSKESGHSPALSPFSSSHLPSRQLSYDFGQHSPQITNSHVYLPNGSPTAVLDSNNRSSSCNQLSVLNVDTGHYHNHLLLKQNLQQQLSNGGNNRSGHNSPHIMTTQHPNISNSHNAQDKSDYGQNGINNCTNLMMAEDEHIYASLPEEEEDEEDEDNRDEEDGAKASSGSFSARSTLPDNCQLISYSPITSGYQTAATVVTPPTFDSAYASKDGNFQLFSCSKFGINGNSGGGSSSSGSNSPSHSANSSSSNNSSNCEHRSQMSPDHHHSYKMSVGSSDSSSSTVHDTTTTEDIYEEVSNLIDTAQLMHNRNNNNNNNVLLVNSRKQSSSQDTLIGFDGGDGQQTSNYDDDEDGFNDDIGRVGRQNDDDEDDEDDDDDDGDDIEDDQISMISEASSSTFSSFTTCANQDFEFIVSQNDAINNDDNDSGGCGNKNNVVINNNHYHNQSHQQQSRRNNNSCVDKDVFVVNRTTKCSMIDNVDPSNNNKQQKLNGNLNEIVANGNGDNVDADVDDNETRKNKSSSVEPSTVSMAAIYYSRFILNESGPDKKLAHRQRPKIDRRQSFSTAYELRQRILLGQLNRQMNGGGSGSFGKGDAEKNKMNLIEEEEVEENSTNFGVTANGNEIDIDFDIDFDHDDDGDPLSDDRQLDYSQFTANLEEMFPYKLSRRISTSEDNLLSIISTIANCGEQEDEEEEEQQRQKQQKQEHLVTATVDTSVAGNNDKQINEINQQTIKDNQEPTSQKLVKKVKDNRKLSELKKNSTLVLNRKESNTSKLFVKNAQQTTNNKQLSSNNNPSSAIPRRTTQMSNSNNKSISSSVPIAASTTFKTTTTTQPPNQNISIKELKSKRNQVSKNFAETGKANLPKLRPSNTERINELGSLWDRSNVNSRQQQQHNNSPLKPKITSHDPKQAKTSSAVATASPNCATKASSLTSSTTTTSSSSSSPSSPSRVPTFIPATQLRSPTIQSPSAAAGGTNTHHHHNHNQHFQSKLLPPSQYNGTGPAAAAVQKQKPNARQNAILAKNALLLSSGISQISK